LAARSARASGAESADASARRLAERWGRALGRPLVSASGVPSAWARAEPSVLTSGRPSLRVSGQPWARSEADSAAASEAGSAGVRVKLKVGEPSASRLVQDSVRASAVTCAAARRRRSGWAVAACRPASISRALDGVARFAGRRADATAAAVAFSEEAAPAYVARCAAEPVTRSRVALRAAPARERAARELHAARQ
jgi:hypothetical protein